MSGRHDTLSLSATIDQVHELRHALDKVRSTSKTVTIDKAALTALLLDHTAMINRLHQVGIEAKEAETV